MAKSAETLAKYLELDDKDYLEDLFLSAEELYESGKYKYVTLEKIVKNGFMVKICGLRALLPFSELHMNHKDKYWPIIAPLLVNCRIKAKIDRLQNKPLNVWVSAKKERQPHIELESGRSYKGVVLLAEPGHIMVDFGLHFEWRKGSIKSHIDGSTLINASILAKYKPGDVIEMPYLWSQQRSYFGNRLDLIPWYGGEVQGLYNTTQKATVCIDDYGKRQLYVNGKFLSRRIDSKEDTHETKLASADFFQSLRHGQEVDCTVLGVNRNKKFVSVRLLLPAEAIVTETQQPIASLSLAVTKTHILLRLKEYWHRFLHTFKVKPSDFIFRLG